MRNLIRSFPLVFARLATLMGVRLSVLVSLDCQRRAAAQPVDTGAQQPQENLRVAAVWARWIKYVHFAVKILTQRIAAAHYGKLGHQLKAIPAANPGRASAPQHWGRLGNRLRQHKVLILIAAAR